jgi:hypothetical protein
LRTRAIPLIGVALAIAGSGCGGDGATGSAAPRFSSPGGVRLGLVPGPVKRQCLRAGAQVDFPLRCPTRFIVHARYDRHSQRFPGSEYYSFEVLFSGVRGVGAQHVIFGGQARRASVSASLGQASSVRLGLDRRLGFPARVQVVGTARVGLRPALVFDVPSRRTGVGPNAGHAVVIWNFGAAAYFVSIHLERLPIARRVATAVELGASMRPSGSGVPR